MLPNHLRISLRALLNRRLYTIVNVLSLSIGTVCALPVLQYVREELDFDTFFKKGDRIYRIVDRDSAWTSSALGPIIHGSIPGVIGFARLELPYNAVEFRVGETTGLERSILWADQGVASLFDLPLLAGDSSTALVRPFSILLSKSIATKYFGDVDAVGETVTLEGREWYVTGVFEDLPGNIHFEASGFRSLTTIDVFRSRRDNPTFIDDDFWSRSYYTYLLLDEQRDPSKLAVELTTLANGRRDPIAISQAITFDLHLQPLRDIHLHSHLRNEMRANGDLFQLTLLGCIALACLGVSIASFLNVATFRAASRGIEIGLRKTLGAHGVQLSVQFLWEAGLLILLSFFVAFAAVNILPHFGLLKSINPAFWRWGVVLMLGVFAASAIYPATFLSSFNTVRALSGQNMLGSAQSGASRLLVLFQCVTCIGLFLGVGVMSEQMNFIDSRNLGYDRENIVILNAHDVDHGYETLKSELLKHPDVVYVTKSTMVPSREGEQGSYRPRSVFLEDGRRVEIQLMKVDYDFARTYGLKVVAGEDFGEKFQNHSWEAVLMNETAVRTMGWTPEAAVGMEIHRGGGYRIPVLGIVEDFHLASIHQKVPPILIEPSNVRRGFISVRIRKGSVRNAMDWIRDRWEAQRPNNAFVYSFLDQDVDRQYRRETRFTEMSTSVAIGTLVVAGLGLFGLASFASERRTREMGIRKAVGATVKDLWYELTRDFLSLSLLANAVMS